LGFKKKLDTTEIIDISLPSGVKGIKKYSNKSKGKNMFTSMKSGAPVHVKASVSYNDLLQHYKANHLEPIRDHSKIKWVYLKSNPFHLDAIAYKGYDDPDEIMDFISKYIDRDKVFDRALTKKIKMFYDALSWDMPLNKENTVERFF
jgi:hypothetical protein